ncbi:hypothetical protein PACTADRAFT_67771 [Pachysolen tannophilus NRRL Y-2460]|uniref:glucan endo-1,3-beta-D-glucosidase n=1 Tax=Pachysolen tannophilus NRRL Y-2460 TaxID=669874 RepID=A0A1E4TX62_PACTA|nr:hypothetical protein PACTADRAFT_67771 [Pachysolen tannophilus NRRL Y-2460]
MKLSTSVLLTVLAGIKAVSATSCSYVSGNYYCDEVTNIVYEGIGYSGSYTDVTDMDETSCDCSTDTASFSGTLSPLDEELSVHFRGPLKLLQFGVYYPSDSSSSKKVKRDDSDDECTTTQHVHHAHKRAVSTEYIDVTATVLVDQYGNTITTAATSATSDVSDSSVTVVYSESSTEAITTSEPAYSTESSSTSTSSSSDSSSSSTSTSGWERVSYYEPGSTTNVTFMNNLGGVNGSGTWSTCFGNSLSYCNSDGTTAASEAVALDEVTIASDVEYIIFSGSECSDTSVGDCGYYRSDIPAYHGFAGASKMFVFEFLMPTESTVSDTTENYDMPAIWLLNAKIPRTTQYGTCSCWATGCGELDLFEILSAGEDKLISHLHDGEGDNGTSDGGGGSQDYFARPTSSTMKAAVIFYDSEVHITVVDNSTSFESTIDSDTVSDWLSESGTTVTISS